MLRNLIVAFVFSLIAVSSYAIDMIGYIETSKGDSKAIDIYNSGMLEALMVANSMAERKSGQALFCSPRNLKINHQDIHRITMNGYKTTSDPNPNTMNPAALALVGLMQKYPCGQ